MIRTFQLHGAIASAIAALFWAGCGGDTFNATEASGGSAGTQATTGGAGGQGGSAGTNTGGVAGTGATAGSAGTAGQGGTGGAGGAPPCQPLSDMCAQCTYGACQDQYCACYADQGCVNLVACLQACPAGDDMCQQQCLSKPAAKDYISQTFLLGDCAAAPCMAECPGVTAAGVCEKCLFTNCSTQMNECLADADCAEILKCAIKCPQGDLNCAFGCAAGKSQTSTNKAVAVQQCSADPMKCKVDCGM